MTDAVKLTIVVPAAGDPGRYGDFLIALLAIDGYNRPARETADESRAAVLPSLRRIAAFFDLGLDELGPGHFAVIFRSPL